jgi:hypothetical protein
VELHVGVPAQTHTDEHTCRAYLQVYAPIEIEKMIDREKELYPEKDRERQREMRYTSEREKRKTRKTKNENS